MVGSFLNESKHLSFHHEITKSFCETLLANEFNELFYI